MPVRTRYAEGTPNWIDLAAEDPAAARAFYGGLFGWEFDIADEEYGRYTMCRKDGHLVAGIGARPDGTVPSAWTHYLASDDVSGTAKRIADSGGSLLVEPTQVGPAGRMAIALDPTGAMFGAWERGDTLGAELVSAPGAFYWSERETPDGTAADAFYGNVFGYDRMEQIGDGDGFDYTVWFVGEASVTGRMRTTDGPPAWKVYFGVADTDATAARVVELGGAVEKEPADSPYGRSAHVRQGGRGARSRVGGRVRYRSLVSRYRDGRAAPPGRTRPSPRPGVRGSTARPASTPPPRW